MSFKKILKSKRAQGLIMEYLCVAMFIAAAVAAVSLMGRITNSFRATTDAAMAKFGAQIQD